MNEETEDLERGINKLKSMISELNGGMTKRLIIIEQLINTLRRENNITEDIIKTEVKILEYHTRSIATSKGVKILEEQLINYK